MPPRSVTVTLASPIGMTTGRLKYPPPLSIRGEGYADSPWNKDGVKLDATLEAQRIAIALVDSLPYVTLTELVAKLNKALADSQGHGLAL